MERVAWKHTLPYAKQIANGKLLYYTGSSTHHSMTVWNGGMGAMEGSSRGREHMCTHG